jgi:hypothetical protein
LVTLTVAVPAVATRDAGTEAASVEGDMYDVPSTVPFHRTAAPETKPPPLTARVKEGAPAVADEGLRPTMVGAEFATGSGSALDLGPDGSATATVRAAPAFRK